MRKDLIENIIMTTLAIVCGILVAWSSDKTATVVFASLVGAFITHLLRNIWESSHD